MANQHRTIWAEADLAYMEQRIKAGALNAELVEHFKSVRTPRAVKTKAMEIRLSANADPRINQGLPDEVKAYACQVIADGGRLVAVYQRFPQYNRNTLESIWYRAKRELDDLRDSADDAFTHIHKEAGEWKIDHPVSTSFVFDLGVK